MHAADIIMIWINVIRMRKTTKNDQIDTQQELLLWSRYQYADPTLKGYFIRDNGQSDTVFDRCGMHV